MLKKILIIIIVTTSFPVVASDSFYFCIAHVNLEINEPISYVSDIYSTSDFYDKDDQIEKSFGKYVDLELYGDLSRSDCYPRSTKAKAVEARNDAINNDWPDDIRNAWGWSP